MIGIPMSIRYIIGEKRKEDTSRAIITITRNVSVTIPLVALYSNYLRINNILDFTPITALNYSGSLFLILILMDTWFYWWHRALHLPILYEFHRHHHSFRPPTTLSYVAMSYFEFVFENMAYFISPPLIWHLAGHKLHWFPWLSANLILLIWASLFHSDECKFSTRKFNINGPREHHLHHQLGMKNGNFSLIFVHWDYIMGTAINHLKLRSYSPANLPSPAVLEATSEASAR